MSRPAKATIAETIESQTAKGKVWGANARPAEQQTEGPPGRAWARPALPSPSPLAPRHGTARPALTFTASEGTLHTRAGLAVPPHSNRRAALLAGLLVNLAVTGPRPGGEVRKPPLLCDGALPLQSRSEPASRCRTVSPRRCQCRAARRLHVGAERGAPRGDGRTEGGVGALNFQRVCLLVNQPPPPFLLIVAPRSPSSEGLP